MDARELRRALRRKLDAEEDRKRHHIYFWVNIDGETFRAAKFSHSQRGQLRNLIIRDTAHRLRLTTAQLQELVDCPLSRNRFLELWHSAE